MFKMNSIIDLTWRLIIFFCSDEMYLNIGKITIVFAIIGTIVKRYEGEQKRRWFGTMFGLSCALFFGGFFRMCVVLVYGTVGSAVVFYSGKRSCHKAAYIYMFTFFTAYRVYENCLTNKTFFNLEVLNLQMMMICKVVGVAHEINASYKAQQAIDNGEENVSTERIVNPSLSEITHYTFFSCWHGPNFTFRTYQDFLTLPFSRIVGISYTVRKLRRAIVVYMIFKMIESSWPVEYCLTPEFEQSSFFHQALFVFMMFHYATFGLSALTMWAEVVYTSIGLGAYPVQGENKTGHGPTKKYSIIKKTTYAEAKKMKYDFNTIKAMNMWTILTTNWMSEQVRGWNMGAQYFLWSCVRQQLPTTEPLKRYRMFLTGLVSAAWHGIEAGCYIALLSIPACLSTEKPYKTLITEYLSGWRATASLFFMYLFRVYIYGFAMTSLCLRDFKKIYKFCTSTYFLPVIVYLTVHIVGVTLIAQYNERKRLSNNNDKPIEYTDNLTNMKRDKLMANIVDDTFSAKSI